MNNKLVKANSNQYFLVFKMLENILNNVSDEFYLKKVGGHIFWQQILHALMGTHFRFRQEKGNFEEPCREQKYYPELEKDPENTMPREQLTSFMEQVKIEAEAYFHSKDDIWLTSPCVLYSKLTNYEIISMQIRHLMYHVGYLNGLLSEYN